MERGLVADEGSISRSIGTATALQDALVRAASFGWCKSLPWKLLKCLAKMVGGVWLRCAGVWEKRRRKMIEDGAIKGGRLGRLARFSWGEEGYWNKTAGLPCQANESPLTSLFSKKRHEFFRRISVSC